MKTPNTNPNAAVAMQPAIETPSVKSEAKAAAARANGKKGGRPLKKYIYPDGTTRIEPEPEPMRVYDLADGSTVLSR